MSKKEEIITIVNNTELVLCGLIGVIVFILITHGLVNIIYKKKDYSIKDLKKYYACGLLGVFGLFVLAIGYMIIGG